MRLHKIADSHYEVEAGGRVLGWVAKTGTGRDSYPWSWWLAGDPIGGGRATGVTDTRREAADKVKANARIECAN